MSVKKYLFFLLCSCVLNDVSARTLTASPSDDVEKIINTLLAGDVLILADGIYNLDERFSFSVSGTSQRPIVIKAAQGAHPRFHRNSENQNIWDIESAAYLTIQGLHFSGGSAGVRVMSADHFVFKDNEIFDTGDAALTMNKPGGLFDSVQILNNHIHHTSGTGEGMYLGCNYDECRISNSLIDGNYIHDTLSADQGDGIEIKEGSFANRISNNVIHDTNYPCIITYGTVGNGAVNTIEGNLVYNCGDHGIQSAADTVIRNNVVLNTKYDGIAMQHHQNSNPANLVVVHNTVVKSTGAAIYLNGNTGSVVIANNAMYSENGKALELSKPQLALLTLAGNVGYGSYDGSTGFKRGILSRDFVSASYRGQPPLDLALLPNSQLIAAGDATYRVAADFNGSPRAANVDVGAYAFTLDPSQISWMLSANFKGQVTKPLSAVKLQQQPLPDWGCVPGQQH
jgi:hypothetical protein